MGHDVLNCGAETFNSHGCNPHLYPYLFDLAPLAPFWGEGLGVRGFALCFNWDFSRRSPKSTGHRTWSFFREANFTHAFKCHPFRTKSQLVAIQKWVSTPNMLRTCAKGTRSLCRHFVPVLVKLAGRELSLEFVGDGRIFKVSGY